MQVPGLRGNRRHANATRSATGLGRFLSILTRFLARPGVRKGGRAFLVVLAVLAVSCLRGPTAPEVHPSRVLNPGGAGGDGAAKGGKDGPFAVVFASPEGETEDVAQVTVLFNRPMRALSLAGEETSPPATIRAKGAKAKGDGTQVPGAFRWLGTSALTFAPSPQLARATEYTVTVPKGVRSLAGEALAEDYSFSFTTARPALVNTEPSEGDVHLTAGTSFTLYFNQPVSPSEVERAFTLRAGDAKRGAPIPFHARYPLADTKTKLTLTPAQPLPLGTRLFLNAAATFHGLEGPLSSDRERSLGYRTYGPLNIDEFRCDRGTPHRRCAAQGYFELVLSNRVSLKDLRAHTRLEGATLGWAKGGEDAKVMVGSVSVPVVMGPAAQATLVVTAGLRDEYGQLLAHDARVPVATDDEWPFVSFGVKGQVFEADKNVRREVPVASMNMDSFTLLSGVIDEAGVARVLLAEGGLPRHEAAATCAGVKKERVQPSAAPNREARRTVRLDDMLAASHGHGAVVLSAKYPQPRDASQKELVADTRLFSVTDLAITARMSPFGSVVWVTHLSSGGPAPGALVAVRGAEGQRFETRADAQGLAIVPAAAYVPTDGHGSADAHHLLVARAGDDWTWKEVGDLLPQTGSAPGMDLSGRLPPMGLLFTDRGIYKAGEHVRVEGLFRVPLPHGTATPKGAKVTLQALDREGASVFEQEAVLGAFGDAGWEVPLPAAVRLGSLELRATMAKSVAATSPKEASYDDEEGSRNDETITASVEIAAYRPAEFKVSLETDRPAYVRGDSAGFTVRGDYLFGAPMGDGKVHFTASRGATSFTPPGAEGLTLDDDAFAWGQPDTGLRGGEFQAGDGALEKGGAFTGKTALAMPEQHGAEVVSFEAEVQDVTRQTLAGRTSAIVHPGEFYLGLRPPKDTFVKRGTTLHAEVLAIEPSGKRRTAVPVQVDLVRRTWESVVEADGSEGHYRSHLVDTVVKTCATSTTSAFAACDLIVEKAGFFLLRATGKDRRGNPLAASTSLYAMGDGEENFWAQSDSSDVDLVLDKPGYSKGDVAHVLVKSPFREAEALVTIERAGVYRQEHLHFKGSMPTFDVPITDDMRPNVFVSVHLVRGRTEAPGKAVDVGAPTFRRGYAEIKVDPEARRLKIAVTPAKKEVHPGDEVECDLTVTDATTKGARAEVTFYAVDEGVLMLTGYRTPDPIATFSMPRPLAVFSLESRDGMARIRSGASGVGPDKGDEGGGGGGSGPAVRGDFRSTAFFQAVTTDDKGRAHLKFELPDSLTTYRLMAVGATEDDRFGFGEAQIVSSKPLMARPNLPRFVRAGDTFEAGVVLSSKGLAVASVEVSLDAHGLAVSGPLSRTVALSAGKSLEVRWPMTASAAGDASFTFHAKGGDARDDVTITRPIQAPLVPEAVALYGETTGAVGEQLGDLSKMRTDVGGLDLRLSSTALVGLDEGVEHLLQYPYGCSEQLTSRLVPLVPLKSLATEYGVALPKDLGGVIDGAVAKIVQNQREDGGFGYWPDSRESDPWVTTYVLWGLDLVKRNGGYVPEGVVDAAIRYERQEIGTWADEEWSLATIAFALDVLATVDTADPGSMNRLYDERDKLPLFGRALLTHAFVTAKMSRPQIDVLVKDLEAHLRVSPASATVVENEGSGYAPLLDSEARTTAMVLRALMAANPQHPLGGRLAKGLLAAREGGTWRSTQETAWALLSLDDYRHAQEAEPPHFDANVFLGKDLLTSVPFKGRSLHAENKSLAAALLADGVSRSPNGSTLAFQVEGKGTLFYEARLRYARKDLPTEPLDRGFYVKKVVRSLSPADLAAALGTVPEQGTHAAQGGDLVLVDLLVVSTSPREQVVIEDPLPAGLEAVQANLATTASSLDVTDSGGAGDQGDQEASDDDARSRGTAYASAWYHRELHDDQVLTFVPHMPVGVFHYRYLARATTFGHFVVPPTHVACMYEPEVFGRTAASTFDVKVPSK